MPAEQQPDGIHTIPVPEGWSVEQAWEAISRGDKLPTGKGSWANVRVQDGAVTESRERTDNP